MFILFRLNLVSLYWHYLIIFLLYLVVRTHQWCGVSLSLLYRYGRSTIFDNSCCVLVKCIKTLIIPSDVFRVVNGLLKTALGPPSGSTTSLSPIQDITFRHESVKCLVSIIKSMGAWMDQQLSLGDSYLPKRADSDTTENHLTLNGEDGIVSDNELHPEVNSEHSDAATLEQRRAYKIELQVEYCHCVLMALHF